MDPILFCDKCRGMQVGWNRRYIIHTLSCRRPAPGFWRLAPYSIAILLIVSIFATPTAPVSSGEPDPPPEEAAVFVAGPELAPSTGSVSRPISDPAVASVLGLIQQNSRMNAVRQARIARAVVASARKYDVDPYLIASVLLVESSGDPFAISNRDAVGIMQIHVPTWGSLVDVEQINLFRIEDNIDLGTRILADYTGRYGLSEGLMRYLGAGEPTEEALAYVNRIEGIYINRNAD